MISYKEDLNFIKGYEQDKILAARVKQLIDLLNSYEKNRKVSLLNELALAIDAFDTNLKQLIKEFPPYYEDFKPYIDRVLKENSNLYFSCLSEIKELNGQASN